MQIITFAAINVGSYVTEMKIYELSARNGMKEIDCIQSGLELGKDAFTKQKIGVKLVDELCKVLTDFRKIMEGYKVSGYRACATSAFRESKNELIMVDYIEKHTGIHLEVLGNSEQRFLDYKSIASNEREFSQIIQDGTAIVDVGGGSVQISLFENGTLITTQNIRIGNLRIREKLAGVEQTETQLERLVEELINNELNSFQKLYLKDREIKNIIMIGDYLLELMQTGTEENPVTMIKREDFQKKYEEIISQNQEDVAEKYEIPSESSSLIIPSLVIYRRFIEICNAKMIWMPGFSLNDGIAYDYAEKKKLIKNGHNFEDDIIAEAKNLAKRYQCNKNHTKTMEKIAMGIFDKMKKNHGMGKRERLLLRIAVILHGCGKYVSLNEVSDCSYSIIMATEMIGLSHLEREIIANVVRYNTKEFEYYDAIVAYSEMHKEEYLLITKLTAILRVANALDRSHQQKFENAKFALKDNQLTITVETQKDITLEKVLFEEKADFFEEVFSVRPVIRQKKHF